MDIVLASILGYLFGSIPFALVIGKVFYKTDIRQHGSGNLGGTNAGRTLGAKAGVAVIIFDVLKGAIAMMLVSFFSKDAIIYAGFFATLGHCFPLFANFKGGKAVSTAFGFLIGISIFITHNYVMDIIIPLGLFFVLLYFSKMVSFSSMIALSGAAITLYLSQPDLQVSIAFTIIVLIVIFRHRENITRILNKTERKITWM